MKKMIFILALFLVGCNDEPVRVVRDPLDERINDQCLRREIFNECLRSAPAGPMATKYNDWDEVIGECRKEAYYASVRKRRVVKPECEGT